MWDSFPPGSVRMRAILPLQGRLNCSPAWRSLPSVCQCCSLCWKRFMIFCKKPDGAWRCFFCVSFSEREERRKSKQRIPKRIRQQQRRTNFLQNSTSMQSSRKWTACCPASSFLLPVRCVLFAGWRSLPHLPCRKCRSPCAKTAFLAQKGLMKELFLLVLAGAVLGSFSSL